MSNNNRRQINIFHSGLITIVLLSTLALLAGCTHPGITRMEQFVTGEANLIRVSYGIADELVERAMPPLTPYNPDMPILVTTYVNNNDLTQTSTFGRILQEHIRSRFSQLGYSVKDIKLTGELLIEPKSGETMLSRDLNKLTASVKSQAIMIGTISNSDRSLYISTRLVNPATHMIISSNDQKLPIDKSILAMFGGQSNDLDSEIKEPRRSILNSILY